jgi:hypothetical protein
VVIFTLPLQTTVSFSAGVTEANGGAGEIVGTNRVYNITETDPGSTVTIS